MEVELVQQAPPHRLASPALEQHVVGHYYSGRTANLQDAVFSAGGTLARLAREGWRVIVATVFTASVSDPIGFALACQLDKGLGRDVDYMALRRDEDASACAAIGAEPLWLPFPEAPHRGYGSAAALFTRLHAQDGIVDTIAPALSDLIAEASPDIVFSPQAIGAHVDHVAVYLALRACDRRTWLWEDFPYAARGDVRRSPFTEDFDLLCERRMVLSRQDVDAKARATTAYASQTTFQFGGAQSARDAIESTGSIETFVV